MSDYDNTNRGVLFTRESVNNQPTWRGEVNIDGVDYYVAGWDKVSKAGNKYISLKVEGTKAEVDEKFGANDPGDDPF